MKKYIKQKLYFIIGINHFFRFVKTRFIEPKNRSAYGYFGETTILKTPAIITNPSNVFLYEDIHVRENLNVINHTGKVIIKKFCGIAPDCTIVTGNHTPTVSIPQCLGGHKHINDKEKDIIIEEGVWLGTRVTLISGAHIGRGAVIGSCSLVNKEIPPYAVAVGSPAKIIASVFTIEEIIEHEKVLYPAKERLSKEFLISLFETYYNGKRTIGEVNISDSDKRKIDLARKSLYNKLY